MANQPFYEGKKSIEMGKGFRPRAAHPKVIKYGSIVNIFCLEIFP